MKSITQIIILLFSVVITLTSCSRHYSITGDVTHDVVRGRMLYLSVNQGIKEIRYVDSCQIVHGRFNIMGEIDSVVMARLYIDNEILMPFVLEGGDMSVKIDYHKKTIEGGELNTLLNKYLVRMSELQTEWEAVRERRIQLYLSINQATHLHNELEAQEIAILKKIEKEEIDFIRQNYTNPLGPGMFILITERMPFPEITPQISAILENAPEEFINSPFVANFLMHAGYKVK